MKRLCQALKAPFDFARTGVSPSVALGVLVPAMLLLAGLHLWALFLETVPSTGSLDWIPAEKRTQVDLSGDFKTLDGETLSLRPEPGQILFLNFWATWCTPCRAEMPTMAELYEELAPLGLVMVAVTDEDARTVQGYIEKHPYPFTIALDEQGVLIERFDLRILPTTLVIDGEGKLALFHVGYQDWSSDELFEEFRRLLGQ